MATATEERNRQVMLRFYALFNGEAFRRKDFSALDTLLAPEFVDHDPIPGQGPGIAGLKEAFAFYYNAFSDFGLVVNDMVVSEHKVAVRFELSGTFDGVFMGAPGNGKRFAVAAHGLIYLNDAGQPTDRWGVADMGTLLQQLGIAA